MSTIRLYHHDDYLKSFEAAVVAIDPRRGRLVLDRTAFYPTGGHQECDQGKISCGRSRHVVVTAVDCDSDGQVTHRFAAARGELAPGDQVRGAIDWPRRYHHMRLHTAQHIFSHWAGERLGLVTGRAAFSPTGGKVVMSRPLTWEEIFLLEADVNRVVVEGREVSRAIDDEGVVTISIDNLTSSPCGGTHVRSTAEIDLFKITRVDGKNLHYQVGERARRFAVRLANASLRATAELACDDPARLADTAREAVAEAARSAEEADRWRRRLTEAQIEAARRNAMRLDETTRLLTVDLSHLPSKQVQNLLKQDLTGAGDVWICMADRRSLLIASASDAIDAGAVLEHLRRLWSLEGAGGPGLAQGGPVPEEITEPLGAVRSVIVERVATPATAPRS